MIKVILLRNDKVLELAKYDSMLSHILKSVVPVPADAELEMTIYFEQIGELLNTNSDVEVNNILAAVGSFGGMVLSNNEQLVTLVKGCDGKLDEEGFIPSPFVFPGCWATEMPEAPAYRQALLGTTPEQDAELVAIADHAQRLEAARKMDGLQARWDAQLKAALDLVATL